MKSGAVALLLGLLLFLVYCLDHPFGTQIGITPAPFEHSLEVFSQRRQQIVEHLARRGESGAKASEVAALETRHAKAPPTSATYAPTGSFEPAGPGWALAAGRTC